MRHTQADRVMKAGRAEQQKGADEEDGEKGWQTHDGRTKKVCSSFVDRDIYTAQPAKRAVGKDWLPPFRPSVM
jgi:hypothetical protein